MMKTGLPLVAILSIITVGASADDGIPAGTLVFDLEPGEALAQPEPASTAPILDLEPATVQPQAEPFTVEPLVEAAPVPVQHSQASIRSGEPVTVLPAGEVDPGRIVPQIDLAPGETVVQVLAVPSIVRVPEAQAQAEAQPQPLSFFAPPVERATPDPVVDPVTGRLRDTPGWTGDTTSAASVGCFPEGACASLNN